MLMKGLELIQLQASKIKKLKTHFEKTNKKKT